MNFYQVVFMNETLGFFVSEEKAMKTVIEAAKRCWEDEWTEDAFNEWIEEFKKEKYDDVNQIWISEEELDTEEVEKIKIDDYLITTENFTKIPNDILQKMAELAEENFDEIFVNEDGKWIIDNKAYEYYIEEYGKEVLDAIITRLYINVLLNENIALDDEFLGELYKLRVEMTLTCFSCGMYTIVDDVDNVFYEILDLAFYEENDYIDLEKCYAVKNVYLEFKGTIWHLSYTESPYHGPEEFEISFENTGEKVFERKFRYEVKE
jgi:hypothetical protein